MPRGPKGEKRPPPRNGGGCQQDALGNQGLAEMVDAAAPKPDKRDAYQKTRQLPV